LRDETILDDNTFNRVKPKQPGKGEQIQILVYTNEGCIKAKQGQEPGREPELVPKPEPEPEQDPERETKSEQGPRRKHYREPESNGSTKVCLPCYPDAYAVHPTTINKILSKWSSLQNEERSISYKDGPEPTDSNTDRLIPASTAKESW
jgi:hypothetical protein